MCRADRCVPELKVFSARQRVLNQLHSLLASIRAAAEEAAAVQHDGCNSRLGLPTFEQLSAAHSRPYRHRFWQVHMRFAAFLEVDKII